MIKKIISAITIILIPSILNCQSIEIINNHDNDILIKIEDRLNSNGEAESLQEGTGDYINLKKNVKTFIETKNNSKIKLTWIDLVLKKEVTLEELEYPISISIDKISKDLKTWNYYVIEKRKSKDLKKTDSQAKKYIAENPFLHPINDSKATRLQNDLQQNIIKNYQQYIVPFDIKNDTKKTVNVSIEWGDKLLSLEPKTNGSIKFKSCKNIDYENPVFIFWGIKETEASYATEKINNPSSITIKDDGKKFDITFINPNTKKKETIKNIVAKVTKKEKAVLEYEEKLRVKEVKRTKLLDKIKNINSLDEILKEILAQNQVISRKKQNKEPDLAAEEAVLKKMQERQLELTKRISRKYYAKDSDSQ